LQNLFIKPFFQIAMLVFFGVANGVGENSIFETMLSVIGSSLILLIAVLIARNLFAGDRGSLVDYLPRGKALVVIGILLSGVYAMHIYGIRPEGLPGLTGHVMIWLAYAVFGFLLVRSRKMNVQESDNLYCGVSKMNGKWVLFTAIYLISALVAVQIMQAYQPYMVMALWAVGIPFGVYQFMKAVQTLSTKNVILSTEIPQK
jgi:hypothetical protein